MIGQGTFRIPCHMRLIIGAVRYYRRKNASGTGIAAQYKNKQGFQKITGSNRTEAMVSLVRSRYASNFLIWVLESEDNNVRFSCKRLSQAHYMEELIMTNCGREYYVSMATS